MPLPDDPDVIAPARSFEKVVPVERDALIEGSVDGFARAFLIEIGAAGQSPDGRGPPGGGKEEQGGAEEDQEATNGLHRPQMITQKLALRPGIR